MIFENLFHRFYNSTKHFSRSEGSLFISTRSSSSPVSEMTPAAIFVPQYQCRLPFSFVRTPRFVFEVLSKFLYLLSLNIYVRFLNQFTCLSQFIRIFDCSHTVALRDQPTQPTSYLVRIYQLSFGKNN